MTNTSTTQLGPALDGQRIMIIGGGRAIGAAIAERARLAGAKLIIATRDGDHDLTVDVLDEASIAAAAAAVGEVDHVISTVSAHHDVPVADLELDKIISAFGAKVFGPLLLAKHFAPIMKPGGSFLFFSGVVGWQPKPGTVVKGVANGAIEHLVRHLAVELAPLRVNALAPGVIDSGTWDKLGADRKTALLDRAAGNALVGRHGTLDDVTDAALWLLSAGFATGEIVHLDGGTRHR